MDHESQAKTAPGRRPGGGRRSDARDLGRIVRRYLGALEASRSSRGKRRTIEGISARLLKIDESLVSADPLVRLHLTQERIDLHAELVRLTNGPEPDLSGLEKDFVRVAKQYGEIAGITFAAWRQVGVDTEVLDQAGIVRTTPTRPDASRVRRTAEVGAAADADGSEPLLPRTDPIAEPELPLDSGDGASVVDIPPPPAAKPAAAPAPEPPPKAPAPKAPTPKPAAAKPAAPKAQAGSDEEGAAPSKLRRKRIAD